MDHAALPSRSATRRRAERARGLAATSAAEIAGNPRARSARLRVAEKVANAQGGRA